MDRTVDPGMTGNFIFHFFAWGAVGYFIGSFVERLVEEATRKEFGVESTAKSETNETPQIESETEPV